MLLTINNNNQFLQFWPGMLNELPFWTSSSGHARGHDCFTLPCSPSSMSSSGGEGLQLHQVPPSIWAWHLNNSHVQIQCWHVTYLLLSVICACIIRSFAGGMYAPPVRVRIGSTSSFFFFGGGSSRETADFSVAFLLPGEEGDLLYFPRSNSLSLSCLSLPLKVGKFHILQDLVTEQWKCKRSRWILVDISSYYTHF